MLYRKIHCKIVADLSIDIFDDNISYFEVDNKMYLENILYLGCLTHDIKKYDKKHCTSGSEFIAGILKNDQFIKENNIPKFDHIIIDEICSIIRFHKSKSIDSFKENLSSNHMEIKPLIFITRICDKMSSFSIESRFKIIKKEQIVKSLDETLLNMKMDEQFYRYGTELYDNILQYFLRRYCNNKVLSF